MDCLVLDSVRKFSVDWEARKLPLNVLINISSSSYMDGTSILIDIYIFFEVMIAFGPPSSSTSTSTSDIAISPVLLIISATFINKT